MMHDFIMYGLVQQRDSVLHSRPVGDIQVRIAGECTHDNTIVSLVSELPYIEHALFTYLRDHHDSTLINIDREYQQSMIVPTGRYALTELADSCTRMTGVPSHVLPFVYSSVNEYRERFPEAVGMIRSVKVKLLEHPTYQHRLNSVWVERHQAKLNDDIFGVLAADWELKSLFDIAVPEHRR